jgi:proline iminopeptidase
MPLDRQLGEVDGATLEFFTGGAGPLLGCTTHGYGVGLAQGNPLADLLGELGRVALVNGRGAGGSSPGESDDELTLHQLVEDLEALRRRHFGGERWLFMGTSAGGFVGLLYALAHPEALAGLVVMSSAASGGFYDDPGSIQNPANPGYAIRVNDNPAVLHEWARLVIHQPEKVDAFIAQREAGVGAPSQRRLQVMRRQLQKGPSLPAYDVADRLGEITVPTLVVGGRHDNICPIRWSEQLHAGIPGSDFLVLEESGHFPFAEQPQELRATVRRFVDERVTPTLVKH